MEHLVKDTKTTKLLRVGELLDKCRGCLKRPLHYRPVSVEETEKVCGTCLIYQELRDLGDQLGGEVNQKKQSMTVEEYIQLRFVEGLTIEEISELKDVSPKTVCNFRTNHRKRIKEIGKRLEGK